MTEITSKKGRKKREATVDKILQVTDKYRILSDRVQYIIQEKTESGNWKIIGYHSFPHTAIKSICNHVIKDDIDNLIYVADQMDRIEQLVKEKEKLLS